MMEKNNLPTHSKLIHDLNCCFFQNFFPLVIAQFFEHFVSFLCDLRRIFQVRRESFSRNRVTSNWEVTSHNSNKKNKHQKSKKIDQNSIDKLLIRITNLPGRNKTKMARLSKFLISQNNLLGNNLAFFKLKISIAKVLKKELPRIWIKPTFFFMES